MTSFTDLHLELEIKAKDFRENPTEANGNRIIEDSQLECESLKEGKS